MFNISKKIFRTRDIIVVVILIIGATFVVQNYSQLRNFILTNLSFSCPLPIEYSVGSYDSRFGISKETFLSDIEEAVGRWNDVLGKELFKRSTDGGLKINLIYDERQKETQVLNSLNLSISDKRSSFDQIKSKYDSLKVSYNQIKAGYDSMMADFEVKLNSYNDSIKYWNDRGGASKKAYSALNNEQEELKSTHDELDKILADLNNLTGTINILANTLNRLAKELNIDISMYNHGGQTVSKEFEEGDYESDINGTRINIYQFGDKQKLINVLTHELGHALSIEHNDSPLSIMYRLNQDTNQQVTAEDIAFLKDRCSNL